MIAGKRKRRFNPSLHSEAMQAMSASRITPQVLLGKWQNTINQGCEQFNIEHYGSMDALKTIVASAPAFLMEY